MEPISAYQNRLAEIKKLEKELFVSETSKATIRYDNEMLQSEYDSMKYSLELSDARKKKYFMAAHFWAASWMLVNIAWYLSTR